MRRPGAYETAGEETPGAIEAEVSPYAEAAAAANAGGLGRRRQSLNAIRAKRLVAVETEVFTAMRASARQDCVKEGVAPKSHTLLREPKPKSSG
jgi:hypothetical protein